MIWSYRVKETIHDETELITYKNKWYSPTSIILFTQPLRSGRIWHMVNF